jgi:ABC-type phosphate transport system substrate-binding protein
MSGAFVVNSRGMRFGALLAFTLFLVGLPAASSAQSSQTSGPISLRGAGSTFAAPFYRKMIEEYAVGHGGVSLVYDSVGSGEGVKRFSANAVDFAGSDEILTASETANLSEAALMVPVTAGMIVLAYNIPGVNNEIKLPRDVYIDIFAGVIKRWDDPRIKAATARRARRCASSPNGSCRNRRRIMPRNSAICHSPAISRPWAKRPWRASPIERL